MSTAAWTAATESSMPASSATPSSMRRSATGSETVSAKVARTAPLVPVAFAARTKPRSAPPQVDGSHLSALG